MNYMQIIDLSREVKSLKEELIRLRRHFHRYPEAGSREVETALFIAEYLKGLGLRVEEKVAGTGVCALLAGATVGKTLLYRSDMDALQMNEESDLPFRSTHQGLAHACGHDAHMAIALVTARLFAEKKEKLRGRIRY
jgi:amidohydrolase